MSKVSEQATRNLLYGAAGVLLIGMLGIALGTLGWRSRIPNGDVISYIQSAHEFLTHGQIPDHGTITSFGSYTPPGLTWLFLPGVAVFSDPRLFSFIGSGLLHIGTLVGIFLLARRYLSTRYALFAVLLYGLSDIGLYFAGALWPRGQPFFYVWMVYWTCLWATYGGARYLSASLITWAAGVFVFMELAPALLIIPVVWFVYRPPLDFRAIALAVTLATLIWLPYLRFESECGFADLRSQILLQNIRSNKQQWCDPALPFLQEVTNVQSADANRVKPLPVRLILAAGRRVFAIARGMVINFEGGIRGAEFIMMALGLLGIMVLSLGRKQFFLPRWAQMNTRQLDVLGIVLIVLGIMANEFVIRRYFAPLTPGGVLVEDTVLSIRILQALLVFWGVAILMRKSVTTSLTDFTARFQPKNSDTLSLALSLAVPWAVLLLVAEHGRVVRFFWLLPVQVIAIAAGMSVIRSRLSFVLAGLLIVSNILGTSMLSAITSVPSSGWAGSDAPAIQVVDFVSDQLLHSGKQRASIGYLGVDEDIHTFTQIYAVGEDFDLLFRDLHQVSNSNRCPEGISADNDYRIVFANSQEQGFSAVEGFHFIAQFGEHKIYKRD
jgi:hypothetical protein